MGSRMEKYDNELDINMSRTSRNKEIYNSLDMNELSRIKTNNNVSVISDAEKEIDIEKIKKYVYSINEDTTEKRNRVHLELPEEEEPVVERQEDKDYDINSVLERAKDKRESDYEDERHRKINNTEYDILKNIKIEEKKSDDDDDITGPIDELNTEEKTIVDLIKTIANNNNKKDDIFKDLMSDNDDTVVMAPIDEEINKDNIKKELEGLTQDLEEIKQPLNDETQDLLLEKEKLKAEQRKLEETSNNTNEAPKITNVDKSFFTNSLSFSKKDFEGFDDIEKDVKKSNFFTKAAVVLIILLLLATIFVILNYVLDLNIL